jgi:hypothetical protein
VDRNGSAAYFQVITSSSLYPDIGVLNMVGSCTARQLPQPPCFCRGLGLVGSTNTSTGTAQTQSLVMSRAGNLRNLSCTATTKGVAAGSGVVTVNDNGSATTNTCTFGTTTGCADSTHAPAYNKGDKITVSFTARAAETLAGVTCTIQGTTR